MARLPIPSRAVARVVAVACLCLAGLAPASAAAAASHCGGADELEPARHASASHASHQSPAAAFEPSGEGCGECGHQSCPAPAHCAAGVAAAAPSPLVLPVAAPTGLERGWRADTPLSANPTPPIPPPQAIL